MSVAEDYGRMPNEAPVFSIEKSESHAVDVEALRLGVLKNVEHVLKKLTEIHPGWKPDTLPTFGKHLGDLTETLTEAKKYDDIEEYLVLVLSILVLAVHHSELSSISEDHSRQKKEELVKELDWDTIGTIHRAVTLARRVNSAGNLQLNIERIADSILQLVRGESTATFRPAGTVR